MLANFDEYTPDQQGLLRQLAKFDDENALAKALQLDNATVSLEIQKIRKKLKVDNNIQAYMKARHFNLFEP